MTTALYVCATVGCRELVDRRGKLCARCLAAEVAARMCSVVGECGG
jgi:hypothetical protein